MARNLTLVATATAMFFSLSGPTKCHGSRCPNVPGLACLRERLDGGLTTSVGGPEKPRKSGLGIDHPLRGPRRRLTVCSASRRRQLSPSIGMTSA